MSGDVQPRKRKDRRRKKEEEESGTPPPILTSPPEIPPDNVTIHIYKESSTGGHWCARIIFFILLAILVALTGVIIFEHRGTTDVDTPLAESRWASIFDGWVDDSLPSHGEESYDEKGSEEEETEEADEEEAAEHEEEEEESEAEEEEDEEHEVETGSTEDATEEEEEEEEEEDEEEEAVKEDEGEDEDEDEGLGSEEEDEEDNERGDEEEEQEQEEDEDDDDVKGVTTSHEEAGEEASNEEDEGVDQGESDMEEDNDFDQNFDDDVLEEVDNKSDEENDEVENVVNENVNDYYVSTEAAEASEEQEDEGFEEFVAIPGVLEMDDYGAEPLEEVEDGEPEEDVNDIDIEPEVEEIEEESTSVAVKFGVGVALIVAAHFVLVRRWNNADTELAPLSSNDEAINLSRRNTIVAPSPVEQAKKMQPDNENQTLTTQGRHNYETLRSRYENLETDSSVENIFMEKAPSSLKKNWSTRTAQETKIGEKQSKMMSSEEETEDVEDDLETSDGERISGTEEYEEEEDEGEDEVEDEEEVEEEIEDVDDSELVARLEAKYGKLETPQDSDAEEEIEDEEEEEIEDEDEEEDIEDEDVAGWKRIKSPKDVPVVTKSVPATTDKSGAITKQGVPTARGGKGTHDFDNVSTMDDVIIHEEREISQENDD